MADPVKMLFMMTAFGIIYFYQGAPIGFGIALVFYFIANAAWNSGGGWPEAWYRVRHIPYRQFYIIAPNARILRPLVKEADLQVGGDARARIQITKEKSGDYGVPKSADEMFQNPHGAPASLHNWDDYRPIPVFGREPDAVTGGGKTVPKAKIDPMLVHAAYKNDVLERRHRLNVGIPKIPRVTLILLIAVVMINVIMGFYVLYFGNNISCAVHAKSCP